MRLWFVALLAASKVFQSTHPVRGATAQEGESAATATGISIHAPREGCDAEIVGDGLVTKGFQSTHPVRGATVSTVPSTLAN